MNNVDLRGGFSGDGIVWRGSGCQAGPCITQWPQMGECTAFHGAPLRLHMPVKYGYKQIKRIGLIPYSDEKR